MPLPVLLQITIFGVSFALFFTSLTIGLVLIRKREPIGKPYFYQVLTLGLGSNLAELSLNNPTGRFGGSGFQVFLLAAEAATIMTLGWWIHTIAEIPFRGVFRAGFITVAGVLALAALVEVAARVGNFENSDRNVIETYILNMTSFLIVLYVLAMVALRWRRVKVKLNSQLLAFQGVSGIFGLLLTTLNLGDWGMNTIDPVSLENLSLFVFCLGNKEAAYRLGLQAVTVRNHIANIYRKTGVKSRVELLNLFRPG